MYYEVEVSYNGQWGIGYSTICHTYKEALELYKQRKFYENYVRLVKVTNGGIRTLFTWARNYKHAN